MEQGVIFASLDLPSGLWPSPPLATLGGLPAPFIGGVIDETLSSQSFVNNFRLRANSMNWRLALEVETETLMVDRKSRRGPAPIPPEQRRTHCVSVRLSAAELIHLDAKRGQYQRGEWLRMAALDKLPPTIPAINREAWTQLARSAANLNQIARHLNEGGAVMLDELADELAEFRRALIGAREDDDES